VALAFDERERLFVAEDRDYPWALPMAVHSASLLCWKTPTVMGAWTSERVCHRHQVSQWRYALARRRDCYCVAGCLLVPGHRW
jgi:hypothetical protein